MDLLRYGIYPLTAFALAVPPPSKTEPQTPELNRSMVDFILYMIYHDDIQGVSKKTLFKRLAPKVVSRAAS